MRTYQLVAALALLLLPIGKAASQQEVIAVERIARGGTVQVELPIWGDGFAIVQPVDGLTIGVDTFYPVVALFRDGGSGIPGHTVNFSTTSGSLSETSVTTDAQGLAVALLRSSAPGGATVTATLDGVRSDRVSVAFDRRTTTSEATYISGGRDIDVTIFHKRIGIQAKSGVSAVRISSLAGREGMEIRQVVGAGIYELGLPDALTLDELQRRARELEGDYPEEVHQAGLVVRTGPEKAPMLLTGLVLTGFDSPPRAGDIAAIKTEFHLDTLEPLAPGARVYRAEVSADWQWDIFRIANELARWDSPPVRFAHPNFVIRTVERSGGSATADVPCNAAWPPDGHTIDPFYCQQWHHDNRGLQSGVIDADIDTPAAWDLATGTNHEPRVAIIDSSFWAAHPDLSGNLWHDPDDGTPGRSFYDDDHTALLDPQNPKEHGTSVAGIVGAMAHNQEGGRGVCPGCELLLIRNAKTVEGISETFYFATEQDAAVISNSWEPEAALDAINLAIEDAATIHGTPIVFAAESAESKNRCNDPADLSSIDEHVIAVSSSTYLDDRTPSGFGNCIDVLAPSRRAQYNGIVTTAINTIPYVTTTTNFGGTSAAAPMVSGTIGLMLDVNPNLTRIDIQRALQDTADKIDPDAGAYDAETGFSQPDSGPATHAYGRINAFEAVSLVAPFDASAVYPARRGRGGMDLILRDHALDWGNTERPSCERFTPGNPRAHTSVLRSADIKLDAEPFQQVEETPQGFLKLAAEEPVPGRPAKVYVRVRNRGPATVPHAWVKLHWTLAFPLPSLQQNFWAQLPDDVISTVDPQAWNPLRAKEIEAIAYSGASAAGCPDRGVPDCLPIGTIMDDLAQIVVFDLVPPSGGRLSLLAVLHSEHDPALPKLAVAPPYDFNDPMTATVWDNNVALWVADAGSDGSWCPF